MNYELAAPPAHAMIESLRGMGYSTETAVADLIDNSIAADARNVWLTFTFEGPDSWMTLLDDGNGMKADELRLAMTLGGRNPLDVRSAQDLGRFGMGLKTASFSQCRSLTVASRMRDASAAVRRWDLDYIARPDVNEWRLLSSPRDGSESRLAPLGELDSGTVVLWENLDRVTAGLTRDARSHDAFLKLVTRVERHLAMVFHRFLEGRNPRLKIHINGTARVRPWDPFLTSSPATSVSPLEHIPGPGGAVELQGFVLPHRDQLSEAEFERGAGREGWTSQQGFYVYRSDRMLVAGGWLGLGEPRTWTREEPFKLARLSVNFPNSADAEWSIDIRKSTARPPRALRPRMTALAEVVRAEARRVFAHRGAYGRRAPPQDLTAAWISETTRTGVRYRINREHPACQQVMSELSDPAALDVLLGVVEQTVPVQRIWLDAVEQGDLQQVAESEPTAEMESMAAGLFQHLTERIGLTPELARQRLLSADPFQNYPTMIEGLGDQPGKSR